MRMLLALMMALALTGCGDSTQADSTTNVEWTPGLLPDSWVTSVDGISVTVTPENTQPIHTSYQAENISVEFWGHMTPCGRFIPTGGYFAVREDEAARHFGEGWRYGRYDFRFDEDGNATSIRKVNASDVSLSNWTQEDGSWTGHMDAEGTEPPADVLEALEDARAAAAAALSQGTPSAQ